VAKEEREGRKGARSARDHGNKKKGQSTVRQLKERGFSIKMHRMMLNNKEIELIETITKKCWVQSTNGGQKEKKRRKSASHYRIKNIYISA